MTAQPTLFDAEQATELARVTGAIGRAILRFCRIKLQRGEAEFRADELRAFVAQAHHGAPASADRVLRQLRRTGQITYVVVNRRASLYRIIRMS